MTEAEIKEFIKNNLTIKVDLKHVYYSRMATLEISLQWEGEDKPFSTSSVYLEDAN